MSSMGHSSIFSSLGRLLLAFSWIISGIISVIKNRENLSEWFISRKIYKKKFFSCSLGINLAFCEIYFLHVEANEVLYFLVLQFFILTRDHMKTCFGYGICIFLILNSIPNLTPFCIAPDFVLGVQEFELRTRVIIVTITWLFIVNLLAVIFQSVSFLSCNPLSITLTL